MVVLIASQQLRLCYNFGMVVVAVVVVVFSGGETVAFQGDSEGIKR